VKPGPCVLSAHREAVRRDRCRQGTLRREKLHLLVRRLRQGRVVFVKLSVVVELKRDRAGSRP